MLSKEAIAQFRAQFRGEVIEPEDSRYNEARKVYNAMIDKKPRLIAQCTDAADVITAVRFGREQKIKVSVRGGGHNAGGLGVADDALVIDLSPIRYVRVDPGTRQVRAGGLMSLFTGQRCLEVTASIDMRVLGVWPLARGRLDQGIDLSQLMCQ